MEKQDLGNTMKKASILEAFFVLERLIFTSITMNYGKKNNN